MNRNGSTSNRMDDMNKKNSGLEQPTNRQSANQVSRTEQDTTASAGWTVSSDDKPQHNGAKVTLGIVGAVVAAAVVAALTVIPGELFSTDQVAQTAAVAQQSSPKQIEQFCPAQMNLADTGSYGDSEFQASTGDIASRTQYVALGSIFHAQVTALSDAEGAKALVLSSTATPSTNEDNDDTMSASDDNAAVVASAESQPEATILDTRILTAEEGTGAAGTLFSWATSGDIAGVSAAGCSATALVQTLLVPQVSSSTTEQLMIANPGDRATTIEIELYGPNGKVAMATSSTISLAPASSTSVDLAAAAGNQDGLYVKLTSSVTPIGAVVRSISMDGLNPNGSDFAVPLTTEASDSQSSLQAIPLGSFDSSKQSLTAYLYADVDTPVTLKWTGTAGSQHAQTVNVTGGNVSVVQLNDAPSWATGLIATTDASSDSDGDHFSIMAKVTKSGNSQEDFALVPGAVAQTNSAAAVPAESDADVVMVNPSSSKVTVTVQPVNTDGSVGTSHTVDVDGESGATVSVTDLGDDVAAVHVTVDGSDQNAGVVWGLNLGSSAVNKDGLAGLSYVGSTALTVSKETVNAIDDPTIVK